MTDNSSLENTPQFLLLSSDRKLINSFEKFAEAHACRVIAESDQKKIGDIVANTERLLSFDVVCIDAELGKKDAAMRLLQIARYHLRGSEVPLLAFSKERSSSQVLDLMRAGAYTCLGKPLAGIELRALLDILFADESGNTE